MTNLSTKLEQSQNWNEIFVENRVLEYPWIQDLLKRQPYSKVTIIEDIGEMIAQNDTSFPYPSDPNGFQKLLIGKQQSKFVRSCPCSPQSIRCGYFFISIGLGCPIDCSYCFLQGFLNTPFPVLYANLPDLFQELDEWEKKLAQTDEYVRAGTGEMTDSLVFEPFTQYGWILLRQFERWPHIVLELKTKTTYIDGLLKLATPNVVLAWSLNPPEIAKIEECHAPSLEERLQAAAKAALAGFRVAFHFDPIIADQDWQRQYFSTLQQIFKHIPSHQIAWISLGTFRIFPNLRDTIRKRHSSTHTLWGELSLGYDGKLRYFRPLRAKIYRQMADWIERLGNRQVPIYLCMESKELWQDVFGKDSLPNLFTNVMQKIKPG